MLDRYVANLSVEVEPFALCMLHFVVQGDGWLSCPDGAHSRLGPNWLIVIPTGTVHSLGTRENFDHELKIDCTPTGPPVHHIVAGDAPAELRGQ